MTDSEVLTAAYTIADDEDDGGPTITAAAQPAAGDTTVGITGTDFNTAAALTDFTIGGAQSAKVTGISGTPTATAVTFATTALAAGDTFTIQAKTGAFSPAASAASNTVTFTATAGAYDKTKLNGEYTVLENAPGTGIAGAGNIYYDGATRQLYLGTDAAYTLDAALDAALITELWLCDDQNYPLIGDKVTYTAGVLSLITLMTDYQISYPGLNTLLSRANIKIGPSHYFVLSSGEITLPPGRTITLDSSGDYPASFQVRGGTSINSTGAKMNTGATGGADIIPTGEVTLVATGSATTFVSSDDTSNLTTTAAPVKSFKAGDLVTPPFGFSVTFKAGPNQDGVISAASNFRDAL
jgi:hypothetical protein